MADNTKKPGKKLGSKSTPKAAGPPSTRAPRSSKAAAANKTAGGGKAQKPVSPAVAAPTKKRGAGRTTKPAAPVAGANENYKYDVCFTFAGENRAYVVQAFEHLKKLDPNARVFYDNSEDEDLWGEELTTLLDQIYQFESRFCVMFISKPYAEKEWTILERRSAQTRALANKGKAYILPAYFDDTVLPGVPRSLGHIDLRRNTPLQLAQRIFRKLHPGVAIPSSALSGAKEAKPRGGSAALRAAEALPKPARAAARPKPKANPLAGAVGQASYQSRIKTSGDWMLLDGEFYFTKTVADSGDQIVVHLTPRNNEETARLRDLDPKRGQHRHAVSFAHGEEAAQVDVREVLTTTSGGKNSLKLTLHRQPSHAASHGADETAERQARRLLLTEDRAQALSAASAGLSLGAYGLSDFGGGGTSKAIFPLVWKRLAGRAPSIGDLLRCARLQAVLDLKTGGIVDHVLDLELGPIRAGVLQVKFRGSRRSHYTRSSSEMAFEGACDLGGA